MPIGPPWTSPKNAAAVPGRLPTMPAPASRARIEPAPDHAEEELAELIDDAVPTRSYAMLPMVGLGGSAGGIAALQAFFEATPAETGLTFVVVMHLAADHESMLPAILQRATRMPVHQVRDSVRVEANHVYVIPPGKTIASANGYLQCADITPERGRRVAVDLFFRTLADTHGPRAAAIVLSGADGDGAIGIKRIKERGGLTIAQDPDEAEHAGMPRAAIATGMIDWVLRVAEMPARVGRYHELLGRLKLPPETGPQPAQAVAVAADDRELALRDVLAYLRRADRARLQLLQAGDASCAGSPGACSVNGIEELSAYLAFLRTHPGEAGALLQDLLISVTNFFRDRDGFDALGGAGARRCSPARRRTTRLRVWVPACATGEEAYSIAILLAEHARTLEAPPSLQVFATDLDEGAIRAAREGLYPLALAADVSEERLRRFFTSERRGYRVRGELRETVLFAMHDLLEDAPFSRVDLFSCRNLLIYLDSDAAEARRRDRPLRLATGRAALSRCLRDGRRQRAPVPGGRQEAPDLRAAPGRAPAAGAAERPEHACALARAAGAWPRRLRSGLALPHRFLLASQLQRSPASAGRRLVARAAPEADRALRAAVGGRHRRIRDRPSLRACGALPALLGRRADQQPPERRRSAARGRSALGAAARGRQQGHGRDGAASVQRRRHRRRGRPERRPGRGPDAGLPARHLRPARRRWRHRPAADHGRRARAAPAAARSTSCKWHLRDVSEKGVTATQELKASNEELQAMNEELRSATEELETSREELQSINEELTTVNVELKTKVDELGRANGDLQNLMAATAIATVFLDRSLRIRAVHAVGGGAVQPDRGRHRPAAERPRRPARVSADHRRRDARCSPGWCRSSARCDRGSRWLLARLLAYRSGEDRIAGVVLTFLDITVRRNAEDALRESETRFRTIVSQAAAGVAHTDLEGRITLVNARFAQIAGRPAEALTGKSVFDLVHPDDRAKNREAFRRMVAGGTPFEMQKRYLRPEGSVVWVSTAVTTVLDAARPPQRRDRDRPRHHPGQARRADAAPVGGAAAPGRRQRARVRDRSRSTSKRRVTGWNIGAMRAHRLSRGRDRRSRAPTSSSSRKTASAARRARGARRRWPRAAPPTSAGT